MEGFPSGQREQTVNLSSMTSVVRIHHLPPKKQHPSGCCFFVLKVVDSKAGSWKQPGGLFQPAWRCRSNANPLPRRESAPFVPSEGTIPPGDALTSCAKAAVSACRSHTPSERDYIRLFATTRRPGAYLSHFPLTRRVKKQIARHIQSPTIAIQIPIAPIPKCTAST